jgi:hypothetical protein
MRECAQPHMLKAALLVFSPPDVCSASFDAPKFFSVVTNSPRISGTACDLLSETACLKQLDY